MGGTEVTEEDPLVSTDRLRRSEEIVARPVEGGAILVNLESGKVWQLNKTGADVWDLLDGQRTLNAVVDQLALRYGVSSETAKRDVVAMASTMLKEGLLSPETQRP
jgi:hypothetical protein